MCCLLMYEECREYLASVLDVCAHDMLRICVGSEDIKGLTINKTIIHTDVNKAAAP